MNLKEFESYLDQNIHHFTELSDRIWDYAEIMYKEYKSVEEQKSLLTNFGFKIYEIPDMETAFYAEYGDEGPIIGFLGEYDALQGLSQIADSFVKEENPKSSFGHGCGHNLIGAGSIAAAVAVKEYLIQNKQSGKVRYYGCPAEEGGSGKVYMIHRGVFDNVDVCLSWHPGSANVIFNNTLANVHINLDFKGKKAHASANPTEGKSAYEGVEFANIGIAYLRGHLMPGARVDFAVSDAGGEAPNIVPDFASSNVLLRSPDLVDLKQMAGRIEDIAKGAAMMSGTTVDIEYGGACANFIPNSTLDDLMIQGMNKYLSNDFTNEELEYAKKYQEVLGLSHMPQPIMTQMLPMKTTPLGGSTDVADISWVVPTAQVVIAAYALGSPMHNWVITAQGKSSIAHKAILTAGKVLGSVAIDLFENLELLEKVKEDYRNKLNGRSYESLIPYDQKPKSYRRD